MSDYWTLERRQKQAQLIQHWQPWRKSTGPITEAGKSKSCMNSLRHGLRSAEVKYLFKLIAMSKRSISHIQKFID